MMRTAISPRMATRMVRKGVMPGLVPGIQPYAHAGASGTMDPGDKHRDDKCCMWRTEASSQTFDLGGPGGLALVEERADAFLGVAGERGSEQVRALVERGAERLAAGRAH